MASVLTGLSHLSSPQPSPLLLPAPHPRRCSPVHPGKQEHCGRPEAWMWQWPILEQKEEQGSLSLAWHLSPVKPEGQVQKKLGVMGDGGLGVPGRAGSRAWQLPPFWQSWASWQGSGNWHVSPRKPGAHLVREERKTRITRPCSPSPIFLLCLHLFPFLLSASSISPPPLLSLHLSSLHSHRHTHWQVPWPSERLRQVPPLAQGPEKLPHGSPRDGDEDEMTAASLLLHLSLLGAPEGPACSSPRRAPQISLHSLFLGPTGCLPQPPRSRDSHLTNPHPPFLFFSLASQVQPQAPSLGSKTTGIRRGG